MKIRFILILLLFSFGTFGQGVKPLVTDFSPGAEGYYFMHAYKMRKGAGPFGVQQIINERGEVIYFREVERASDFKLHSNGLMSFFSGNKFFLMDGSFNIIDSVGCVNGIETDSHDFLILPNGNYLLLGTQGFVEDMSRHRIFFQNNLPGSRKALVKTGVVQELNSKKELVYEWRSADHYKIEDADPIYLNDTAVIDITHFNSIEPTWDGNFIISSRYFNEIIKVRKTDGVILWRMGGPYKSIEILNDSIPFLGQHDAREIAPGHILLFDNGYAREGSRHGARAIEYKINEFNKTAEKVWSYTEDPNLVGEATGGVHRMSNGNTLINFGKILNGKPNIMFVVVDSLGRKKLKVSFPDTLGSYRCYGFTALSKFTSQPQINVTKIKGRRSYKLTATIGEAFIWSTGETTREITIKERGSYYVYIGCAHGGFLRSEIVVSEY